MAAQPKDIDFTEFWPAFCKLAVKKGFTHKKGGLASGAFMRACGLSSTRFSEFENEFNSSTGQKRRITSRYFMKLKGGLRVGTEEIEKAANKKLTKEQREELGMETWVQAHRDLVKELMKDPQKLKICRDICNLSE